MILNYVLNLYKNTNKYRQDMYKLTTSKGFSDPEVIALSQQLDKEIIQLQKIISQNSAVGKDVFSSLRLKA
ncbi:hypothetical protein ABD68_19350 [Bacillus endophyticus]|uniref:aspartyl-phosphate phosphatase Spo0E family protein n=1 Tax=Priestia endophytica TaxID=135735 RepID=UPI0018CD703F|nr:aspartyl-phosphate phosphatase Spo0E family protein [Priestia endophytica]MBG9813650.1 hypothetical protein [Priestia endophytica]